MNLKQISKSQVIESEPNSLPQTKAYAIKKNSYTLRTNAEEQTLFCIFFHIIHSE